MSGFIHGEGTFEFTSNSDVFLSGCIKGVSTRALGTTTSLMDRSCSLSVADQLTREVF